MTEAVTEKISDVETEVSRGTKAATVDASRVRGLTVSQFRALLRDSGFTQATVLYAKADDGREVGDRAWDLEQESKRKTKGE